MTAIDKEWCLSMAKKEEGDIAAGKLAMDPTTPDLDQIALEIAENFHSAPEYVGIVDVEMARRGLLKGIELGRAQMREEAAKVADGKSGGRGCGCWCIGKAIRSIEL